MKIHLKMPCVSYRPFQCLNQPIVFLQANRLHAPQITTEKMSVLNTVFMASYGPNKKAVVVGAKRPRRLSIWGLLMADTHIQGIHGNIRK